MPGPITAKQRAPRLPGSSGRSGPHPAGSAARGLAPVRRPRGVPARGDDCHPAHPLEPHKLTDVVTVDRRAAIVGESTINVRPGEQLTVRDLIKGALIQSANDAAAALALSMAPSFASFAQLMNAKAAALGLHDTHFVRPDGLDVPDHYSSAADMTKLARILMHTRFVRDTVDEKTDTIAGGAALSHAGGP